MNTYTYGRSFNATIWIIQGNESTFILAGLRDQVCRMILSKPTRPSKYAIFLRYPRPTPISRSPTTYSLSFLAEALSQLPKYVSATSGRHVSDVVTVIGILCSHKSVQDGGLTSDDSSASPRSLLLVIVRLDPSPFTCCNFSASPAQHARYFLPLIRKILMRRLARHDSTGADTAASMQSQSSSRLSSVLPLPLRVKKEETPLHVTLESVRLS